MRSIAILFFLLIVPRLSSALEIDEGGAANWKRTDEATCGGCPEFQGSRYCQNVTYFWYANNSQTRSAERRTYCCPDADEDGIPSCTNAVDHNGRLSPESEATIIYDVILKRKRIGLPGAVAGYRGAVNGALYLDQHTHRWVTGAGNGPDFQDFAPVKDSSKFKILATNRHREELSDTAGIGVNEDFEYVVDLGSAIHEQGLMIGVVDEQGNELFKPALVRSYRQGTIGNTSVHQPQFGLTAVEGKTRPVAVIPMNMLRLVGHIGQNPAAVVPFLKAVRQGKPMKLRFARVSGHILGEVPQVFSNCETIVKGKVGDRVIAFGMDSLYLQGEDPAGNARVVRDLASSLAGWVDPQTLRPVVEITNPTSPNLQNVAPYSEEELRQALTIVVDYSPIETGKDFLGYAIPMSQSKLTDLWNLEAIVKDGSSCVRSVTIMQTKKWGNSIRGIATDRLIALNSLSKQAQEEGDPNIIGIVLHELSHTLGDLRDEYARYDTKGEIPSVEVEIFQNSNTINCAPHATSFTLNGKKYARRPSQTCGHQELGFWRPSSTSLMNNVANYNKDPDSIRMNIPSCAGVYAGILGGSYKKYLEQCSRNPLVIK